MSAGSAADRVLAERLQAEQHGRRLYLQGWWWGFSFGLVVGCCSTGLLAVLVWVIASAMQCPQC